MGRLIATTGLPGCGKSTWAALQPYAEIVTKDDIRASLVKKGWTWSKEKEHDVVVLRDAAIAAAARDGVETIISADTNFGGHLEDLEALATRLGIEFEVKSFTHVPVWECAERNAKRGYTVPEKVIWDMAERYLLKAELVPARREPQLFVDLDGVLADFDGFIAKEFGIENNRDNERPDFWDIVGGYRGRLYFDMPPTPYAMDLWASLKPFSPVILSGAPFGHIPTAGQDKREWVRKNLDPEARIITCKSRNKSNYLNKGDILLDDWPKYRKLWEDKGGIFVHHTGDWKSSYLRVKELLGKEGL